MNNPMYTPVNKKFAQADEVKREISRFEYDDNLFTEVECAANTEGIAKINVNDYGAFLSQYLYIMYTTVNGGVDDGICNIRIQISDTGLNRKLTNGFIPINLIASPGRYKSLPGSGNPSSSLFYPFTLRYYFERNTDIEIQWKNLSADVNTFFINFKGRRYDRRKKTA